MGRPTTTSHGGSSQFTEAKAVGSTVHCLHLLSIALLHKSSCTLLLLTCGSTDGPTGCSGISLINTCTCMVVNTYSRSSSVDTQQHQHQLVHTIFVQHMHRQHVATDVSK